MYTPKYIKASNFISFKELDYNFRIGESILIQGKNSDDPSQKSNGVGKSALIELISFIFTGSSIRDIVIKDLVYNGEKSLEAEIYLENPTINKNLKIWRKVYSNTKAAEWKMWINGVEKTDFADFNNFNKIVFEQLGITKDDFFNFYLLTDENSFKPFLASPDAKKKEIINRFSGANKIDEVFPHLDIDITAKEKEINSVQLLINDLQSRQQLLTEQALAEEEKLNPDKINELGDQKKLSISNIEKQIESEYLLLDNLLDEKSRVDSKILLKVPTDFNKELDIKNFEKSALVSILETYKKELVECKDKFKAEIHVIILSEEKLKTDRQSTRNAINEFQQFIDDINNKLQSSIDCPACGHKFTLQDKEFNVQEATDLLPTAIKDLDSLKSLLAAYSEVEKEIEISKQEVNQKVLKEQESVKERIYNINVDIVAKDKEIIEINNRKQVELNEIASLNQEIKLISSKISLKENEIAGLKTNISNLQYELDKLYEIDRSRIVELETQILKLIDQEESEQEKLQRLLDEKKIIDEWSINFKNFKSHLANKSLRHIQDFTNLYLKEMGSNISIDVDGYRMLANKKLKEEITTTVNKDGFPVGGYGKFSKGERGRVDICSVIGLKELIDLNSPTGGLDLLVCDEVLDAVDTLGIESIITSCQGLGKTLMIVSQNEINTLPNYTLTIKKENNISTIL